MNSVILSAHNNSFELIKNSESRYTLVAPENPTEVEVRAVKELQRYIKEISQAELPILSDSEFSGTYFVSIGNTRLVPDNKKNTKELEKDGFHIFTRGDQLYILGGSGKGVLYGVYEFLEHYIGLKYFAIDTKVVPEKNSISLPGKIDDKQVPAMRIRSITYPNLIHPEFLNWVRLSSNEKGGWDDWGYRGHSFQILLPYKEYFDIHPEYFSMQEDGKREPHQPCLSNPDVFEIISNNLQHAMDKKPEARYWFVGQDDNILYCKCPECAAIDKEEGSPSGSIIRFVNKIAERFPEKIIVTYAYQYSRKAPRKTRPANNVLIELCSIESDRSKPIEQQNTSPDSFTNDMKNWGKLTENIMIYDYIVQYRNYVSPFPNLRVLQPNMQFYRNNNAIAIHHDAGTGGEFRELRAYLICKLMWNPDCDIEKVKQDFMEGYYGKAAPYVNQYIDLLHDNLEASGDSLGIFNSPRDACNTYLSEKWLAEYNDLFDKAESAVINDAKMLSHVKAARLPLLYARLEQAVTKPPFSSAGYLIRDKRNEIVVSDDYLNTLNTFVEGCRKEGIWAINEHGLNVDRYYEIMSKPKAFSRKVTVSVPGSDITISDGYKLTDRIDAHLFHWLSSWMHIKASSFEAIIDLEHEMKISQVDGRFRQDVDYSVFYPEVVRIYTSTDGVNYRLVATKEQHVGEEYKGSSYSDMVIKTDFLPVKTRYIKYRAEGKSKTPDWCKHPEIDPSLQIDEVSVF